jgi:hypothetical protein
MDANLTEDARIECMKKNPHAVALGRLGGLVGGPARAKALGAKRRREIAARAGSARTTALSAAARASLARGAARARWSAARAVKSGADAPQSVRRLLKSYEPSALDWSEPDHRYVIVREILLRGDEDAARWLKKVLSRSQVRALVRGHQGAGANEPDRERLRQKLGLSVEEIPRRPYLGFAWPSRS